MRSLPSADRRPYRFYLADWKAIEAVLTAGLPGAKYGPP
jgi:hypothetical protein